MVDQDVPSILGLEISTKLKLVHCIDVISNRAADPDVFQTHKVDLKALVYHKGCIPYCHHWKKQADNTSTEEGPSDLTAQSKRKVTAYETTKSHRKGLKSNRMGK